MSDDDIPSDNDDVVDEQKEWQDLEGIEQDMYPQDDEPIQEESDDEIQSDHGKGYKRPAKVKGIRNER